MPLAILSTLRRLPAYRASQLICTSVACLHWGFAGAATLPAAPQTFDTTYAAPSGSTINVGAGGDLQSALNNAQLGETIVLQAGATFTGPFTLPNKTSGSGWIYVISSNYASLPGPGQRVGPSNASNMPKIVSPANANNAVLTTANSHNFRFVGIEFAPVSGAYVNTLAQIGNADSSPATLPNHIVFNRCYVHADPVQSGRRGIEMDGAYIAVIDSYITNFKETGADTQALWAYNTTGPLKIVDNYLEAAGENILFGGADSLAASLVPSDIDIENNYFFKPLSVIGSPYNVKNLLEIKAAKRVLVSGNTFVNNPAASQSGFALLVTPRNQSGAAPWSTTTDVAVAGNTFTNVGSGFSIAGFDSDYPTYPNTNPGVMTVRVLIRNNVIGVTGLGGADGRAFQFTNGGSDYTVDHNTIINTASAPGSPDSDIAMADTASLKVKNFVFTNNLSTQTTYGFFGSGVGVGTPALNGDFSNWSFLKNAIVGATASYYPPNNFFPASVAAVDFTNYAGGNYTLASASPYRNAGTDGLDIGATSSSSTSVAAVPNPPTDVTVH